MSDKSNPLAGRITTYFSLKTTHRPHAARVERFINNVKGNTEKLSSIADSISLKCAELNEELAENTAFLKQKKRPEGRFPIGSALITNTAIAD
ncbi:hypothetical protein [Rouxiella chamberiensis]|uniref:Uncharacterized protein n=1 Tax=Rouxiella chamberiensis TaxID=1513468 RepID=A0ABY7HNW5_9GAMM|nr:hypothetical protein [Rouxiella chamberiensis]WAT00596.1 hypothetical protein O1V66_17255 [Rouxiella chamberiensis]